MQVLHTFRRDLKFFHSPFLAIVFKIQLWLRVGYKPACRFLKRSISEHRVQESVFSKNDFKTLELSP